jgi:hypothetical protein
MKRYLAMDFGNKGKELFPKNKGRIAEWRTAGFLAPTYLMLTRIDEWRTAGFLASTYPMLTRIAKWRTAGFLAPTYLMLTRIAHSNCINRGVIVCHLVIIERKKNLS